MVDMIKAQAQLFSSGPAFANRFKIQLPSSSSFDMGVNGVTGESINIFCSEVSLPSRMFDTVDNVIGMVGVKMPNRVVNDDISFTFILDGKYQMKNYFDAWQAKIFNPESQNIYELGFREDYAKPVQIFQLDKKTEKPIYGCNLNGAYPISVEAIRLSNDIATDVQRVTVTLSYATWDIIDIKKK